MPDMNDTTSGSQAADQMQQAGTQAPDPSQNVPDAQQPDQSAQTTQATQTPQTPQMTPEQTAAKFPFPGDQQAKPQQPGQASPATPSSPAAHPAVQKASLLHDVAEALGGGPRYTTSIDPNTGTLTRTPAPVSGRNIGLAIAMEALGGAAAGFSVPNGPGNLGRAAAAGYAQQQQQAQKQQQQQADDANQNYARAAQIANTNFQTHQNAVHLGQLEYDAHKQYVADAAPVLDNVRKVNAILAEKVHEGDLFDKYHVTKDMAIVDGVIPRMDPNTHQQSKNPDGSLAWDNTYSVIDPNAKIELPQDTLQMLADHHVPSYYKTVDGKTVPMNLPADTQIRAKFVVDGLAAASAVKITEQQVNKQLQGLATGDQDAKQFDVNLTKALEDSRVSTKDLQVASRYTSLPLNQWRAAMEKDKVNPETIGNVTSLIPQEAYTALDAQQAKAKADAKTQEAVENQAALLPGEVKKAALLEQTRARITAGNAFAEGYNHEAGTQAAKQAAGVASGILNKAMVNNPDLNRIKPPVETPVNGVNEGYLGQLKSVDPVLAQAVDAVGHGQAFVSNYGLAKDAGQKFLGYVHNAFPDFAVAKANEYEKQMADFGINGKTGKANTAGSTLMEHLLRLNDSVGVGSSLGVSGKFDIDKANATNEMGNFYANGNKPGENELKDYRDPLGSKNPLVVKPAIVESAKEAMDKIKENYGTQVRATPKSFPKPEPILSEDAANAYHKLTGEYAPSYLIDHSIQSRYYTADKTDKLAPGSSQGPSQNTSQAARQPSAPQVPQGATHTVKGSDGNLYYTDGKNNLGMVPKTQ